jgi:hypothetical protein
MTRADAMHVTGVLIPMLMISAVAFAGQNSQSPGLHVTAEYRCLSTGSCDSAQVLVQATNASSEQMSGCFATLLTWHFEPSDSLRLAFAARVDSLEAQGGHTCRWHPVSYRIGDVSKARSECHEIILKPGQGFSDTLTVETGASEFVKYPGILDVTVMIWSEPVTTACGHVAEAGSCRLPIKVPR